MKSCTDVSRKTVREDRIAICPKFGCEFMKRVKPLKMRFIGFGKHPKCKYCRLNLQYFETILRKYLEILKIRIFILGK